MTSFFAMGGYGAYVWAAYGFAILVMLGLLWQSLRLARKRQAELEALKETMRGRRRRAPRPLVARRETPDTPIGETS
jgi:heme exporter protein D